MCPLDLFSLFCRSVTSHTHTTLTNAAHNAAGNNWSGRHFSVHSISSRLDFVCARCLATRGRGVSLLAIHLSSSVVCVVDLIGHYRDVITEAKTHLPFPPLKVLGGVCHMCCTCVCNMGSTLQLLIWAAHYNYYLQSYWQSYQQ